MKTASVSGIHFQKLWHFSPGVRSLRETLCECTDQYLCHIKSINVIRGTLSHGHEIEDPWFLWRKTNYIAGSLTDDQYSELLKISFL
jgi:hypothetical protein